MSSELDCLELRKYAISSSDTSTRHRFHTRSEMAQTQSAEWQPPAGLLPKTFLHGYATGKKQYSENCHAL
jgi:hypothetical protein